MTKSNKGWRKEPRRHSLSARGIKNKPKGTPSKELPSEEEYVSNHMRHVQEIQEQKEQLANSDDECYFIESVSSLPDNIGGFHLVDGPFTYDNAKEIEDSSLFPGMWKVISRSDAIDKYHISKDYWIPIEESAYIAARQGAEDMYDDMVFHEEQRIGMGLSLEEYQDLREEDREWYISERDKIAEEIKKKDDMRGMKR